MKHMEFFHRVGLSKLAFLCAIVFVAGAAMTQQAGTNVHAAPAPASPTNEPPVKPFAPEPTAAEPVRAAMKPASQLVKADEPFDLLVSVRLADTYQIYGKDTNASPFLATEVKLTLPKGIEAVGEWTAPEPRRDKAGDLIYTESVLFRRKLKARPEAAGKKLSIVAQLEYQACNDQTCFPPDTAALETKVEVAAIRQP
jgi:hypothetical protein